MKFFAFLLAFGLGASSGTVVNFDSGPVGKTPPGWKVGMTHHGGAPKWEIRKDQSAPTQPYVLAQVSDDGTNGRSPLAILESVNMQDGDISVRVKAVAGREDQGGGLIWRYRDENNYYVVRANAIGHTIAVYKVENGTRSQLMASVKHEAPASGWSILKVSARGSRFQVYVDHRRLLQGQDNTFQGPGKVGLCTEADSVTYFDDFRVYPK